MTITLAAVYAPIGFVSGLTGALFREFAFTLAGSVVVSGFIALTLSPMMCSRLLKAPNQGGGGRFVAFLDRMFDRLRRRYERRLDKTLRFRAMTMLVLCGILALTTVMYLTTPKELAPEEDQGILLSLIKTPQSGNLDYLERATTKLWDVAKTVPEMANLFVINGFNGVHQGFAGILLKPWDQRTRNQKQVTAGRSRRDLRRSPKARPLLSRRRPCPARLVDRRCSSSSARPATISRLAGVAETDADRPPRESGMFIFTDLDLRFDTPQIEFKIDSLEGEPARHLNAGRRLVARDHARRQLRQSLQSLWPQL